MKKARFVTTESIWYENVPIPEHLTTSKEILEYIKENLEDFVKYRIDSQIYNEGLYQAIIEDEQGNETTVTIDEFITVGKDFYNLWNKKNKAVLMPLSKKINYSLSSKIFLVKRIYRRTNIKILFKIRIF